MFSGRKRCPSLAEFLDDFISRYPVAPLFWQGVTASALGIGATIVSGSLMANHLGILPLTIAGLLGGLGVGLWGAKQLIKPPPSTQDLQRQRDAYNVATALATLIARNRIHRDMDPGSLALFEEAARLWLRIKASLASASLTDPHLAPTYIAVRDRIALAANEAMVEMLLAYRLDIATQPSNWSPLEIVDEALDGFGIRKSFDSRQPPPAFYGARYIAEKLQVLADETEALARDRLSMPQTSVNPSRSIDAVLGELRSIRQAEDELRQDVGNQG